MRLWSTPGHPMKILPFQKTRLSEMPQFRHAWWRRLGWSSVGEVSRFRWPSHGTSDRLRTPKKWRWMEDWKITFPTLHLGWIFGKVPAKVKISWASTFFGGDFIKEDIYGKLAGDHLFFGRSIQRFLPPSQAQQSCERFIQWQIDSDPCEELTYSFNLS